MNYEEEARQINFGFNDNRDLLDAKIKWLRQHDARLIRELKSRTYLEADWGWLEGIAREIESEIGEKP